MNRPLSSYIHELESAIGSGDTSWLDAPNMHKVKSILQTVNRKFCQDEGQVIAPMTNLVEDIRKKMYDNAHTADTYSSNALVISVDVLKALLAKSLETNVSSYSKCLESHRKSIASENDEFIHQIQETITKITKELDFYMERCPNTRTEIKRLLRRDILNNLETFLEVGDDNA